MTTSNPSPRKRALAGLFAILLLTALASQAGAQSTFTWNGGSGTDGNLTTSANWVGGSAPGSLQNFVHFAGTTRLTPANNFGAFGAGYQIFFDSGAGAFTLSGNAINFYNFGAGLPRIENDSTNLQTISISQVDVESNMTLYANTGNLSITSQIYLDNSTTLTSQTNSGTTVTFSGSIANGGGGSVGAVAISGAGKTIFTTANNFTGGVTLSGGTLGISAGNQLGALPGVASTQLTFAGSSTLQFLASGGQVNPLRQFLINSGVTGTIDTQTFNNEIAGVISGSGALAVTGSGTGTFSLSGVNTYTGGTTVSGGTLKMLGAGALGNTSGSLAVNSGTLDLNGTTQAVGNFSGTGGTIINNSTGTNVTLTIGSGNGTGGNYQGVIADHTTGTGTVALTKTGSGTITLSGANTYSGPTTISAGTLQIGNNGTTGILGSGAVTNNATLDFNRTNFYTVSQAIGGTGKVVQDGTGTLVLSGANTYSGETDINAGILQVNTATTGNGTAGTFYVGNGGTTGTAATLSLGAAITLANPMIINPGSGSNRVVSATNAAGTTATYSGAITLNNAAVFTSANANALLAFAGSNSININSNQLTVNGSGNTTISEVLGSANAAGGSLYKDGSGTLILQNTGNTYTGTSSGSLNGSGTQINAGTLGIYGDGSLGVVPSGPYANIQFTGSATLQDTANDISLNVNRNITIATGATATFDTNGHALTINGVIGSPGAVNVVKAGSGNLTVGSSSGGLANNSTWTVQGGSYSSTTGLYDSVLALAAGNVLGNATGNLLNLNAGTLQFTANGGSGYLSTRTINVTASGGAISDGGFAPGDATVGGSTIAPAITIASGSGLNLVSTNALKLYSVISGNGTLTKFGNGTATLLGSNTYTGATTIKSGTLQIGSGGTSGSLSASSAITNNGTLVFNRSNTVTAGTDFSGSPISGSGSIMQNGSGKLLLWSGNTFTGGVTINSGTLGIWEGSSLGALPGSPTTQLTFGGNSTLQFQQTPTALPLNANRLIAINAGVTATIDTQGFNPSIAGIISGSTGALAKIGSGTLALYGNNTYGGGTSVSAGTLILGSSSALGSTTGALAVSAATLNLSTYSPTVGALSSAGGIFTGFNLGVGGNALAASSASFSGTTYIGINSSSVTGTGTSNLITSSGGGLTGTFQFAGAQNLSVPVNSLIVKNGSGSFYQVTLNNTATAEQAIVSSAPSKVLSVMPLGASIMAGSSAQTPYSGGGFHTEMYQNLVNDGRFTPNFVGSSTNLQANSPTSPNILTSAGQTNSEGHPGYTTSQILNNLNANDGSIGNNGGYWLSANNTATNGANSPNYIPLNAGGNDFVANHTDTQTINRYDAIISQVNTLRPGVDTLATNLMYRTDVGTYINTYFNPYVQGVVYNHVLAGQNVRFVDLYTLLTPGNSTYPANPYISSDGTHPTQAGYNLMGDIFYSSTVYGAAYWTGTQGGNWSTLNGTNTNWAMDSARTTDRQALLTNATANTSSYADVYFNSNSSPLATTLGADTTIRGLNFAAGATGPVTVGGNNTLSLGSGGITVQQGTGAHTVAANIVLAADQTWGNVSSNNLTVSGVVSGSGNLTIAGSYTVYTGDNSTSITPTTVLGTGAFVLSGNNTYTGTTTVTSGTLVLNGTNSSSGVAVASGATLGGSGRIAGAISGAGQISPGNSPGILAANQVNPAGGLGFNFEFTATGAPAYGNAAASVNDVLRLTGATTPFVSDLTGSNAVSIYLNLTAVSAGNTFQGGFFTDKNVAFLSSIDSAVFAYYVKGAGGGSHAYNGFSYYTLAEYDAGLSINLSTIQVTSATFADGTVTNGYISELSVVPEPTTWALLAFSLTTVMVLRRRRRS